MIPWWGAILLLFVGALAGIFFFLLVTIGAEDDPNMRNRNRWGDH